MSSSVSLPWLMERYAVDGAWSGWRVPAMAAKGKENRILVTLACVECKERNYITEKNKKNDPDRMELRKYCPRCRQHRQHRETK